MKKKLGLSDKADRPYPELICNLQLNCTEGEELQQVQME
jgi:hypothetical protein